MRLGGGAAGSDAADSTSSAEDDTRGLLSNPGVAGERHSGGGGGGDDATASGAAELDIEAGRGDHHDRQGEDITSEEEEELAYTAAHVTSILKPVAATMIMVILCMKITQGSIFASGAIQSPYLVYREESSDSAEQLMTKALVNSLVILVVVLTMTFVMYLLYKYNCIKFLIAWLALSVATLLAFSGGTLFYALATSLRSKFPDAFPAIDTNFFILWQYNFAVVGVACVFWKSPLIIKQVYLVVASCIMAWILTNFFPAWTIWTLLFGLAVYDIFAVLAPCGPLKAIVELSQERGDAIPALIYSASAPERRASAQPRPARRLASPCQGIETASTNALRQRSASPPGTGGPHGGASEGAHEGASEGAQRQNQGAHHEGAHLGGAGVGGVEVAVVPAASADQPARQDQHRKEQEDDDDEDDNDGGVKLGLGDFIFYSVLIGRAAMYDFTTVVTCFIAIITGLVLTLFCLAIARKALPALPFSIFLGIAFYFVTRYAIMPFTEQLQTRMIFF